VYLSSTRISARRCANDDRAHSLEATRQAAMALATSAGVAAGTVPRDCIVEGS
jgi:hypothetical protein